MAITTKPLPFDPHPTDLLRDDSLVNLATGPEMTTNTSGLHTSGATTILGEWLRRKLRENEQLKHSIAGAGAGCSAAVVTCPLDVVKTRLQNQGRLPPGVVPYRGTVDALRRIWLKEGIRGLYCGLEPTVMGYLPTWAIYFSVYDWTKAYITQHTTQHHPYWLTHMCAAATAAVASNVCTNPFWVIKTRMMTQGAHTDYRYQHTFQAFKMIWKEEGIRGYYKGLGTSFIGIAHVAVQLPLYERLKVWLNVESGEKGSLHIVFASGLSKMAASITTYPHEVIRTRLQNQTHRSIKYHGIIDTVRKIHHEEGWRAFYKGMPTNLLRTVPTSAITFLTYELLVRQLTHLAND